MDNAGWDYLWQRRWELWDKRDDSALTEAERLELADIEAEIMEHGRKQRDAILAYAGCDDTEEEVEARRACWDE